MYVYIYQFKSPPFFLGGINHDWMYPFQLTLWAIDIDPEICALCGFSGEEAFHHDYNRKIYEAVAGLGDGPSGEWTQIVSAVFYKALQMIYESDS